jgi:hypothetical protein
MAAPIYSQAQADAMIVAPKYISYDAWNEQWANLCARVRRPASDEDRVRIKVESGDGDLTEFCVECCKCPARGEASYTLFGKLLGYVEHPLCRYDLQVCRHTNPRWFPPWVIGSRVLHRHIYNERAIRENCTWDKCAEPLKIPKPKRKLSFQQSIDRLTPHFLTDIKLDIYDPKVAGMLFQR